MNNTDLLLPLSLGPAGAASPAANHWRFWPAGDAAAVGEAAGGGLGVGINAVTSGGQIESHPETLLRFRTADSRSNNQAQEE